MRNEAFMAAWARLTRTHGTLVGEVQRALKAADLPPLEWYDVLLELERAGRPMRARDLEAELLLAQYNLSRLLDRMEQAGLIVRAPDPADGRGRLISTTPQGLKTRAAMWPVYRTAVGARVAERLSDDELATLSALLGRLLN